MSKLSTDKTSQPVGHFNVRGLRDNVINHFF